MIARHILCIDASNLLHRFFHGMPEMYSPNAEIHTHALTAWVNFLCNINNRMSFLPADVQPIVFFDRRRDLVADGITVAPDPTGATPDPASVIDYKGQRKATDEKLIPQLNLAEHLTQLLGIAFARKIGHEADTLLGSVALTHTEFLRETESSGSVHVLSTDKDMLQLVNDSGDVKTLCIHPQTGGTFKIMDSFAVREKLGVAPEKVADLLAMMGDACDNIPGIPGVGHKTAVKLIETYGGLDGLITHMGEIPGKLGDKIRQHAPYIPALRKLVTFQILSEPVEIREPDPNPETLVELLTHLEMRKTVDRVKSYLNSKKNFPKTGIQTNIWP